MTRRGLRGAVLPILLLAAWEIACHARLVDPRFLPPLELVARTFVYQVLHEGLLHNLAASLLRDMAGFSIGALIGLTVGTALGLSRTADRLFMPSFNGVRQIAILAWIPLISIWFGVGEGESRVRTPVAIDGKADGRCSRVTSCHRVKVSPARPRATGWMR